MRSPEFQAGNEQDPRLQSILEQYGDVLVLDHKGQPVPLRQATDTSNPNYCPPFVTALLSAESVEQLDQIVSSQKATE